MADNGAKEPLLSWSLDPASQEAKRKLGKRRLLHSKSAPLAPPETHENRSIQLPMSVFGKSTPSFREVAIYFAVYLGVGAVIFYLVRNQIKGNKTVGVLDA